VGTVTTVYTDLAILDVTADGLQVREIVEGVSFAELQAVTGAPLVLADDWCIHTPPEL
jgi:3-oxoadipate CoA-transferase beta subunit